MNKLSFVPSGLVISAFFAFMLVFAPVAHAQYDDYGYDGGCCDFGGGYDYSGDSGYSYSPDSSYGYTPDYSSSYAPDYTSSYSYTPDSYDYGSGYDSGSLDFSGSLGLGFSPSYSSGYGGYSYPYTSYYPVSTPSHPASYYSSSTYAPTTVTTNTNTNTNTNNNSCTSGSCNIAINNSTPIVQQSTPTIIYTPPVYTPPTYVPPVYNYNPTCQIQAYPNVISYGQAATLSWSSSYANSGFITYVGNVAPTGQTTVTPAHTMTYIGTFTGQNGQQTTCSATVSVQGYPMVYNNPPTVTLSAVPYTGLDLGTWGTAAYWGFLALMALLAAYLLVVKRVQNGVASKMSLFLFGDEEKEDAFLRSQIHRS